MSFANELKDFVSGFKTGYSLREGTKKRQLQEAQKAGFNNWDDYQQSKAVRDGAGGGGSGYNPGQARSTMPNGGAGGDISANSGGASTGDAQADGVLNFIRQHEASGNYNAVVGGGSMDLSNMTIAQVLDYQNGMKKAGKESTAIGGYQFIQGTLRNAAKQAGLDINTTKMTPQIQDKLAYTLMKGRGWDKFKSGEWDQARIMSNLSKEWAALPKDSGGASYHEGVGSNHATTTWGKFAAAFNSPGTGGQAGTVVAQADTPPAQALPLDTGGTPDTGIDTPDPNEEDDTSSQGFADGGTVQPQVPPGTMRSSTQAVAINPRPAQANGWAPRQVGDPSPTPAPAPDAGPTASERFRAAIDARKAAEAAKQQQQAVDSSRFGHQAYLEAQAAWNRDAKASPGQQIQTGTRTGFRGEQIPIYTTVGGGGKPAFMSEAEWQAAQPGYADWYQQQFGKPAPTDLNSWLSTGGGGNRQGFGFGNAISSVIGAAGGQQRQKWLDDYFAKTYPTTTTSEGHAQGGVVTGYADGGMVEEDDRGVGPWEDPESPLYQGGTMHPPGSITARPQQAIPAEETGPGPMDKIRELAAAAAKRLFTRDQEYDKVKPNVMSKTTLGKDEEPPKTNNEAAGPPMPKPKEAAGPPIPSGDDRGVGPQEDPQSPLFQGSDTQPPGSVAAPQAAIPVEAAQAGPAVPQPPERPAEAPGIPQPPERPQQAIPVPPERPGSAPGVPQPPAAPPEIRPQAATPTAPPSDLGQMLAGGGADGVPMPAPDLNATAPAPEQQAIPMPPRRPNPGQDLGTDQPIGNINPSKQSKSRTQPPLKVGASEAKPAQVAPGATPQRRAPGPLEGDNTQERPGSLVRGAALHPELQRLAIVKPEETKESTAAGMKFIQSQLTPGQPTRAVGPDPAQGSTMAAFASNEGGLKEGEYQQLAKQVDPEGKLPQAERILKVQQDLYDFYMAKGYPEKAAAASASVLMYGRRVSQLSGAMAQAALSSGDLVGAGNWMAKAYETLPDGKELRIDSKLATEGGQPALHYQIVDLSTGQIASDDTATPDELLTMAKHMSSGAAWAKETLAVAQGLPRTYRGASRIGGGRASTTQASNEAKQAAVTKLNEAGAAFRKDPSDENRQAYMDAETEAQNIGVGAGMMRLNRQRYGLPLQTGSGQSRGSASERQNAQFDKEAETRQKELTDKANAEKDPVKKKAFQAEAATVPLDTAYQKNALTVRRQLPGKDIQAEIDANLPDGVDAGVVKGLAQQIAKGNNIDGKTAAQLAIAGLSGQNIAREGSQIRIGEGLPIYVTGQMLRLILKNRTKAPNPTG